MSDIEPLADRIEPAIRAITREKITTERTLAEVKKYLAALPREQRVYVATHALPGFERLARLYNDLCEFMRVVETGADGSA